jgi:hypothetical protein
MENEFHPVVLGADTTNLQESGISALGSAITQGGPAAIASGLLSIWNTFQPAEDEVNTSRFLHDIDNSVGDYYDTHKEAVDMVGFVGTSFIPGTAGIKALKLASSGEALGAVGRGLGLAATKKAAYLEQAMIEIGKTGGAIPKLTNAARMKNIGWEVADQALQGLAFESAVALTMRDSPVFDNSTHGDFAWNMTLGTVLSGVIGGPLASIGARGILKSVQADVEAAKRSTDVIWDTAKIGLLPGTSTLLFAENIAKLPDAFVNLKFSYKYDGLSKSVVLEGTDQMLKDTRAAAVKAGEQKLALAFNELAGGNAAVGQSYLGLIKEGLIASREAGKSVDEQIQLVSGYLNNVESISHADLDKMAIDAKKFYVTIEPEDIFDMYSTARIPGKTGKTAYQLSPEATQETLKTQRFDSTGFPTLKAAWRSGEIDADVLIMPNGRAAINPNSKHVTRIFENINKVSMWVDVRTGNVTPEAVIHFADTIVPGKLFNVIDSIGVGNKVYKQAAEQLPNFSRSAIEGSARWAWVSKFGAAGNTATIGDLYKFTGGTIDSIDLPVLARVLELRKEAGPEAVAKFMVKHDGDIVSVEDFIASGATLEAKKYEVLQAELMVGEHYDLSHLAAHLNTTEDFVETAIRREFIPPGTGETIPVDSATALALAPKTVKATWNFKRAAAESGLDPLELYQQNFGPAFQASQQLSRFYNLEVREQAGRTAANVVLAEFANNFPDAPKNVSASTSQAGAGANILGASNADYGNLAQLYAQETGKQISITTQRIRDAEITTLAPAVNAIKANDAAAAELGVLTNALRKSKYRYVVDPDGGSRIVSTDLVKIAQKEGISLDDAASMLAQDGKVGHIIDVENKEVIDLWNIHARLNTVRQEKFTVLHNAAGLSTTGRIADVIYVPPVNTVKYPYHAFVRTKEQLGVASDITMITAKDEASLRKLVEQVDTAKYDVHYKKDSELYHKAKGDYDYQMTVHESTINSELSRTGKLADFFPETTAQNVLTDYLEFHSKQTDRLIRTAVQVKDRQFFGELQFLSDNYRKVAESTATGFTTMLKKKVADPFGDYIKTALNVSKQQEFPLLDKLNEFIDRIGLAAGDQISIASDRAALGKSIKDPGTGLEITPWEYADKISKKVGLGMPYGTDTSNPLIASYIEANRAFPKNLIRESFQKANMMLANFTLRLDFANSLINIISTGVMTGTELQSIKGMIAGDNKLAGMLTDLRSVKVPGQELRVPSNTKLMGNAINNFFGADKQQLLSRYKDIGAIKTVLSTYHDMLDDLAFNSVLSPATWTDNVTKQVDKMAKYTGNNFSEEFTRFITADVMRQLTDPLVTGAKMSVKDQNAYINVFVNRVQGNYVTSQRPVLFQGTTGAAVSLFQTYAFNVLQQLYRHVEGRDVKTLAVFAGLQSTVFGFNGLPFFDAVNTHLIGSQISGNTYHGDAYSVLPAFNKELGDWLLYGTASAFPLFSGTAPALYSRGDINPRHITVIPISPLDVPAVQASMKLVGTIAEMGKNLASGVDVTDSLLNGLEHQGISRPLAGFAQLLAGRSTTSQGALISASNDLAITNRMAAFSDRVMSIEGVSRLAGARPMDEAVALNNLYRNKSYDALDKQRLESLGRTVKTALRSGEAPSEDQLTSFMGSYAAAGGRQENFSSAIQRWQRDASVSVINRTAQNLSSNSGRRMQDILGGYTAPDFTSQPVPVE